MVVTSIPDSDGVVAPQRSPDGQFLVATNPAGDRLLLFSFATQKWSELVEAAIGSFEWSADSRYLYFDNGYSAEQIVSRIRISDRKVGQVANLKDLHRVVVPWITWFGVTPEGSLLFMRDTGSQEVYALDFEEP